MKRVFEDYEKIKVSVYIYLWESYHKSNSLKEFEERYVTSLTKSSLVQGNIKYELLKGVLEDFYAAHGVDANILFQNDEYAPVVIEKKLREQENIFTAFLLKKLDNNPQTLNKAEDRDDVYYLHMSDLKRLSFECFGELLTNSEMSHIYRTVIRKIFDLDDRDAIFFNANKAIIKFFSKNRDTDRRFGGIAEERLSLLYENLKGDNKIAEINNIFARLAANELNLKKVDNLKFHASYIKLFLQNFQKLFSEEIEDKELLVGFCSYFFRKNYGRIIQMVVDELISCIPENSENIKNFINFYDGKEVIIGLKKVKKSEIIIDEQRYSYFPIYKVIMEKLNIETLITTKEAEAYEQKNSILKNEHLLASLSKELKYLKNSETVKTDSSSQEEALKAARMEFQELQIKLIKCKDKQKRREVEERLNALRDEIDFLSQAGTNVQDILRECAQDIAAITRKIDEIKNKNRTHAENIKRIEEKIAELKELLLPLQQKEDNIKRALMMAIVKFRV